MINKKRIFIANQQFIAADLLQNLTYNIARCIRSILTKLFIGTLCGLSKEKRQCRNSWMNHNRCNASIREWILLCIDNLKQSKVSWSNQLSGKNIMMKQTWINLILDTKKTPTGFNKFAASYRKNLSEPNTQT